MVPVALIFDDGSRCGHPEAPGGPKRQKRRLVFLGGGRLVCVPPSPPLWMLAFMAPLSGSCLLESGAGEEWELLGRQAQMRALPQCSSIVCAGMREPDLMPDSA